MKTSRWGLLLVLALVLASCGDDGGATRAGGGGEFRAYCDAILKIETVEEPDIDFESLTPEQQAEAAKTLARESILPLAEDIVAVTPAEIKADIDIQFNAVKEIVATGNFEAFDKPEVQAASDRTHAFDLANCGWGRVEVTGVEYAFQGIPERLNAGPTTFEFANEGKEEHELSIFRINDDVTEPLADILKLPEEEAQSKGRPAGGTFAEPGDDGYKVVDLEPGRYGVICFIPVGGKEGAPPHFTRGMLAEFTVA